MRIASMFCCILPLLRPALMIGVLATLPLSIPAHAEDIVSVKIGQARIIKLPPRTKTLVIGNPIVADVTLIKGNELMTITGKSFGDTNMIALDTNGEPLAESIIRVSNLEDALIMQVGAERRSYACDPRCQPTVKMGDAATYTTGVMGQIQAIQVK
jgi:Flp pilus assembly secretin CpaC